MNDINSEQRDKGKLAVVVGLFCLLVFCMFGLGMTQSWMIGVVLVAALIGWGT